ncbi:MAG: hypothetical protein JST19_22405, partial [Bacteroidetes bacterium]|nr:hypothetical protein [Bacteroidota bacterium]
MKRLLHRLKSVLIAIACLAAATGQAQIITTIVGTGTPGSLGDGGPATAAEVDLAQGVVKYYAGNLYITDQGNQRIRKVDPFTGIITTVIGNGTAYYSGDGGPATAAEINDASYMDFDNAGNMYFSDVDNDVIRKVSAAGIISTFAGVYSTYTYNGDGIAATTADLSLPEGIVVDKATGNVYFCDNLNARIRMVDNSGIIHTVGGNGTTSYSGDGGPATAAEIANPVGLCMDGSGNLYFSDAANYRIRKINTSGIITTFAGTGTAGYSGDGYSATAATMRYVEGLAYDAANNRILLSQSIDNVIRAVSLSTNIITTVAGNGYPNYSGDGGPATAAELHEPNGVDADCLGNIYIADYLNARIRFVSNAYNHRPVFANGSAVGFTACSNTITSINSLLGISDTDAGQTEWWVAYSAPAHGTLGGFDAQGTAPSSLGIVTPSGLTYTSAGGYTGTDNFVVGVADCSGGTALINVSVTVNPLPAAITGTMSMCTGASTTLADVTGGGTWSSISSGIATAGSSTGVVSGVSSGIATIFYTLPTGCYSTAYVTVNPLPGIISGATTLCAGSSATLSVGPGGGTWSS